MTNPLASALVSAGSQDALERTSNVLSNTFRQLSRMVDGHEVLVLVILGLLILMYLDLRSG
jgi:hypothetical protein